MVHTRESDSINALEELETAVKEDSSGNIVFSNVLLNNIMNEISDLRVKLDDPTNAKNTLKQLIDVLSQRKVSGDVIANLETKHDRI